MTTKEWGTVAGWVMGISVVLLFTVGFLSEPLSAFFLFTAAIAGCAWTGLGVRDTVETYDRNRRK